MIVCFNNLLFNEKESVFVTHVVMIMQRKILKIYYQCRKYTPDMNMYYWFKKMFKNILNKLFLKYSLDTLFRYKNLIVSRIKNQT